MKSKYFLLLTSMIGFSTVQATERWWDGGSVDILTNGDGTSAGGTGTWNSTLALDPNLNWDQGASLAHVGWDNSGNDTAIFGGTGGTVTLGSAISAKSLVFAHTSSTYTLSGSYALTLSGTAPSIFAANTTNISTSLIGSNGLTKSGAGLVAIKTSTSNNSLTGGLTINQGIVELDLNSMTTPVDMIAASNTLTLNNGYLRIRAKTSSTSSQTLGAVTLSGATGLNITHQTGIGTVSTLTLGTITRNAGSTLSFSNSTIGTSSDFYVPVATNLGNWAITSTVSGLASAAPIKYATVDGAGKVIAVAGTAAADAAALTDTTGAVNYDLALATGTVPTTVSANSVRYTGAAGTTTLGTSFTVNSLMNGGQGTGSGLWTIGATANAGTIRIGTSDELILHPGANGITINSKISGADAGVTINSYYNGTTAVAVTLGGTNDYTGKTIVNGSNAYASGGHVIGNTFADAGSAFGAGGELVLNGATILSTPTSAQSTNRAMTWNGNSGFYSKTTTAANKVTLNGNISGSGTFNIDHDYSAGNAGTENFALIVAGNNDYSGEIQFQTDARLVIDSANSLKNATLNVAGQRIAIFLKNNHAFNIGSLKGNGLNLNLGAATANGGSGFVSIGANNQSNAFLGELSGTAGLIKKGTGTQTLVKNSYTGNTVIENGTLKLGTAVSKSFTGSIATDGGWVGNRSVLTLTAGDTSGLAVGQVVPGTGGLVITAIESSTKLALNSSTYTKASYSDTFAAMNGSIASTTIEVKSGAFLDVTALNGGFNVAAGQTLKGNGTVTGNMTIGGTLAPGASPGILTVNGNLTLGGTVNLELAGTTAGVGGYDQVALNGSGTLGGTLSLAWSLLSAPTAGTELVVINNDGSDSFTGAFSNAADGSQWIDNLGGTWNLDYTGGTGNDLTLVAAVPEPGTALLGGLGLLALLRRRRR